jgi:hypothetical protein
LGDHLISVGIDCLEPFHDVFHPALREFDVKELSVGFNEGSKLLPAHFSVFVRIDACENGGSDLTLGDVFVSIGVHVIPDLVDDMTDLIIGGINIIVGNVFVGNT